MLTAGKLPRRLAALALLLSALAVYGMAQLGGGEAAETGTPPERQAARVLARLKLPIPPSAKVDYAQYMTGLDDAGRLILVMPASDWLQLAAAPPFGPLDPSGFTMANRYLLGPDEGGWTPNGDPSLVVAGVPWASGQEWLNIGLGDAGPGQVRVYLFWHQL